MTHACLRCRRGRRRCQPGPNGSACERCSRHGKQDQCSYKDVGQVRQPQRHSKTNDADEVEDRQTNSALNHLIAASETSLMHWEINENWTSDHHHLPFQEQEETHPPQTLPDSSPSATGTPVPSIRQPFDMPSLSPDFLTQPPLSKSATPVPHSIQPSSAVHLSLSNAQPSALPAHLPPPLNQLLLTLDTSLAHCEQNNWITEDPDMMPTVDDYILVWKNLTNEGLTAPLLQSLDGERCLQHFFTLTPLLRLTHCALAAELYGTPEQSISYFRRARKAVYRYSGESPTLETVQAYYNIYLYATWKSQPVVGRRFLEMALQMIKQLRLDVDPDYSPWINHLNLAPRQKEERRRAFWACYWMLMWEKALTDEAIQDPINADMMKPPTAIYDPHLIFTTHGIVKPESKVYSLIGEIRKFNAIPPISVDELFLSQSWPTLCSRLGHIHATIPENFLLLALSPENVSPADSSRFLIQLSTIPHQEIANVFNLNLNIHASISLLHRPRLFSSSLLSLNPAQLSTQHRDTIVSSINTSLASAHRITSLFSFFRNISTGDLKHLLQEGEHSYHKPDYYSVYALFEAVCVFWFMACRMNPLWWNLISRGECDRKVLQARLDCVVEFVKAMEKDSAGTMTPLLLCMEAMLGEMDGSHYHSHEENENGVEELVLGMKVVSIGNEDGDEVVKEPWAFLGLLGMQVGGRIRWKGRTEESWRLFWKLYS